jgi:integrase
MPEYSLGKLGDNWVVVWKDESGKRRRYRLFGAHESQKIRSKQEAQRRKKAFERQAEVQGEPTIEVLWQAYVKEKEERPIARRMLDSWKAIAPTFQHLKPEDISTEVCRDYSKRRAEAGRQAGTIWTELGHLRNVLSWSVQHRLIEFAPPIERPQKPAPRERYLTSGECQRLIEAADTPHIKLAIILMLSTACRVGALLELTWDRVDFERGQINFRNDSNITRKGRATVPMNDGARSALQEAHNGALTEYVIEWNGKPVSSIKTSFRKAVAAAKLENVSPHVLRHTAAVHLAAAGVPMQKISQYLGHSNTAITESTYARYAPDHLREESSNLDFTRIRKVQ